jgi:exodeoxyribonuclease V alpha subunit
MGEFEMQFTLDKVVYQKNDFKIVRVKSTTKEVRPYLNTVWGNVSIKGEMPVIKPSVKYSCIVKKIEENGVYGYTLTVSSVYPMGFGADDIKTDSDLISFVEVFVGEGTADKLRKTKGILKMVQEGDIKSITNIKGVGEKTAKKLFAIYQKEAVGSKYLVKIKQLGFSDNEIKTLKKMYDDNLYMAWESINHNIFALGFRLDRMDKIFLEGLEGEPTDKRRLNAYISKGLKDYMYQGYRSYIPLAEFYNLDIMRNIESRVGIDELKKCVKDLEKKEELKIIEDKYITTFAEWQLENNVKFIIEELMKNQNVEMLPIEDIDKEIDEQEEVIGFKLNEGQRKAVKDIILSDNCLNVLTGYAGTGKTSVTKVILNIYTKYNRGEFKLCALSGRASSILGESSGYPQFANTIHRTLGFGEGGWKFTKDNKFTVTDVLVIDEISMIDYYLLYSILAPVSPNMKVILLGDSGQLPSLSFGKTIETLELFGNGINRNELTQIMRQKEDAFISKVANDVRQNINPFENTKYKWYGSDVEVCIGDSYQYMLKDFIEKYKEDKNSTIIVTTTKAKTDMLNFDIQNKLIQEGLVNDKSPYIIKPSSTKGKVYKMYIDDNVMVLKNNHTSKRFNGETLNKYKTEDEYGNVVYNITTEQMPIFNGEIYTIKNVYDEGYVLLTDDKNDIIVDIESLECCLAYASNCHKLQGSSANNVYVYHTSEWVDTQMMCSAQWLYTGYTRAKKLLSIHTDQYSNISKGVRKNAVDEKVTILELLMK